MEEREAEPIGMTVNDSLSQNRSVRVEPNGSSSELIDDGTKTIDWLKSIDGNTKPID